MKAEIRDVLIGGIGALSMYFYLISKNKTQFIWWIMIIRVIIGVVVSYLVGRILQESVLGDSVLVHARDAFVGLAGIVSYMLFDILEKRGKKIIDNKINLILK